MPNALLMRSPLPGQTQWTAQFLAAAELVRLGYEVSFTMGNNTPRADMMVGSQERGAPFWVDVKGSVRHNGWFIKQKAHLGRLYYILVDIGSERENDCFFILSQEELAKAVQDYSDTHTVKAGREKVRPLQVKRYKGKWKRLPKPRARL
jgi:hypothetical protein